MTKNKFFIFALTLVTLFSCSTDDDNPPAPLPEGAYSDGLFVLNEGNFGSGNSSVSFISEDLSSIEQQIFQNTNSGSGLGDTATDIGFYENYAFVVVNVSNKIEIVDRNTWESIGTIDENLSNPRKIAFSDGKAYITNWGDGNDPADDYVAVFEVSDLSFVDKISVEEGPDEIVSEGDKIFVAHAGGFSFNDLVTVIDSTSDTVLGKIQVGDVPNALAVQNGTLWVSSSGLPSYASEGETAGSISKIEIATSKVIKEFIFPESNQHPANLVAHDGLLFYTLGNNVYRFSPEEGLPETAFLEPDITGVLYGMQVWDGKLFLSAANADFTGNGEILIYDLNTKELLKTFEAGINPNGIFPNS